MKKLVSLSLVLCSVLLFVNCKSQKEEQQQQNSKPKPMTDSTDKIAAFTGPFEGVPQFENFSIEDVKNLMREAIDLKMKQIDSIAQQKSTPTFENTFVPYEKSGAALDRVFSYYGVYSSNESSEKFRKVQEKLAPEIAEYSTKIYQNKALFDRIKHIYKNDTASLKSNQKRLVKQIYTEFQMRGANLDSVAKKRYAEIQQKLSKLYTQFSNNVLADEEGYITYLNSDQLSGLPESLKKSAAKVAKENGKLDKYAITNTRSSMDPFLTYSDERALRKKVWQNYYSRGNNGGEHDNNSIIKRILKLRDERVELLGYENYASWRLSNRMAKNPEKAMDLLMKVWKPALARVKEEVADMQKLANSEDGDIEIKAWDYRYYMEKVREKRYQLNSEQIKPYLQLKNLRKGMFDVAGKLFGFKFRPITEKDIPVFNENVKVWKVTDKKSDSLIGLWYLDPYARKGKRSGAWATTYRSYAKLTGGKPVLASNNSNFIEPAKGDPVLLSWADAETFFHEFGHALHFLSSDITYPTLDNGLRDYTEFQSQLLERWLLTDNVIDNYLKHYKTGKPMPDELVKKIKKSATFNQGFGTTEYLASAIMDLKYHTTDPSKIKDVQQFEKEQLDKLNMPDEIPMRHRTTQFGHIFSGEGYSAGYYGYLWSEVLTADAAEAFANAPNGFYNKELARKLKKYLFAPRNAIDPEKAYRKFRGSDAKVDALLRDRGFPVKKND